MTKCTIVEYYLPMYMYYVCMYVCTSLHVLFLGTYCTCDLRMPCTICMCINVANPIDLLAKYANMTEDDVDIEIQEPYNLLKVRIK